jgi:hypothetical protein
MASTILLSRANGMIRCVARIRRIPTKRLPVTRPFGSRTRATSADWWRYARHVLILDASCMLGYFLMASTTKKVSARKMEALDGHDLQLLDESMDRESCNKAGKVDAQCRGCGWDEATQTCFRLYPLNSDRGGRAVLVTVEAGYTRFMQTIRLAVLDTCQRTVRVDREISCKASHARLGNESLQFRYTGRQHSDRAS